MLAGLGANHGIGKNIPFVVGLICSATVISIACLLGFQVALQNPVVYGWLIIAGAAYIMYLAVKLYRMRPTQAHGRGGDVMYHFRDGLLVTLLNPKFYVMVTAVFAQFISPQKHNAVSVCIGFVLLLLCAHIAWLGLGKMLGQMGKEHGSARHLVVVNKIMGVSLFVFAFYFLYDGIVAQKRF